MRNLLEYYYLVHTIKAKFKYLDLKQSKGQKNTEGGETSLQVATTMMDPFLLLSLLSKFKF